MEKNYFTDLVGIGVTYPIQLTTNEKGERGWYPVNGDFKLIRDIILHDRPEISTGKLW